jgi:hypothetical protein
MRKKFKYSKLPATPTEGFPEAFVYQPLLPVTLVNPQNGQKVSYIALVDSGADFCLFHGQIGEAISLDVSSGKTHHFGGVARSGIVAFVHEVDLYVEGLHGVRTRVAFSYEVGDPYKGFLGQRGFFSFFKITFHHKQNSFSLRAS